MAEKYYKEKLLREEEERRRRVKSVNKNNRFETPYERMMRERQLRLDPQNPFLNGRLPPGYEPEKKEEKNKRPENQYITETSEIDYLNLETWAFYKIVKNQVESRLLLSGSPFYKVGQSKIEILEVGEAGVYFSINNGGFLSLFNDPAEFIMHKDGSITPYVSGGVIGGSPPDWLGIPAGKGKGILSRIFGSFKKRGIKDTLKFGSKSVLKSIRKAPAKIVDAGKRGLNRIRGAKAATDWIKKGYTLKANKYSDPGLDDFISKLESSGIKVLGKNMDILKGNSVVGEMDIITENY